MGKSAVAPGAFRWGVGKWAHLTPLSTTFRATPPYSRAPGKFLVTENDVDTLQTGPIQALPVVA